VSPAARSRLAVGEAGATGDAGADILRSAVRYGAPPAAAARACPPRSKGAAPSVLPVCRLRLDGVPNSTVCRGRSRGVAAFPPLTFRYLCTESPKYHRKAGAVGVQESGSEWAGGAGGTGQCVRAGVRTRLAAGRVLVFTPDVRVCWQQGAV